MHLAELNLLKGQSRRLAQKDNDQFAVYDRHREKTIEYGHESAAERIDGQGYKVNGERVRKN